MTPEDSLHLDDDDEEEEEDDDEEEEDGAYWIRISSRDKGMNVEACVSGTYMAEFKVPKVCICLPILVGSFAASCNSSFN
jgi:hypothetical protein